MVNQTSTTAKETWKMKVIPTEMELVAKSEDVKAMKAVISNKLLIIAHSKSKKYWVPARYY